MDKKLNNKLPIIIIDATHTIGSEPIALMKVLSQPWIINFIEIIDSCNALDRLQIITPTKFKMDIKYVIEIGRAHV